MSNRFENFKNGADFGNPEIKTKELSGDIKIEGLLELEENEEEDREIFLEFQKRENETLERNPSRFKKVFAFITTAAILMMATPAFGESPKSEFKISEPTKIELKTEAQGVKSAEEIKLFADLEKSGYSKEEIYSLFEFTRDNKVPIEDMIVVAEKMNEKSDKMMFLKTYAIAYDAVNNNKLSSNMRKRFQEYVLPNLKNGIVDVIRVQKEDIKGADAIYDGENDAYKSIGIDLKNPADREITIHELVHVSQDALELMQKREDSEHEAEKASVEYSMRGMGFIREDREGGIIFPKIKIDEIKPVYQQLIIYENVLKNAEREKNNLNTIIVEGIDLSSLDTEEAINFYKLNIKNLSDFAKSMWAVSTDFSSMISGKKIDTQETLIKNGLKRLKK